ncbi:MAG TPA: lysylphosphatidylglycerol synthase domain-containing protein [Schlesneria sp.]
MNDISNTEVSAAPPQPGLLARWWPAIKWTLFAATMYFVVKRAVALWQSSPPTELRVDVWWLIPAAALYLIGWFPSIWFWHALLKRLDQHAGAYETTRAYFIGHLGKYVPGKAMVLLIRGALLKQANVSPVLAALTAAYETLVSMAAAVAISVALAPLAIPDAMWERLPSYLHFLRQQPFWVPLIVVIATVVSTPFSAWLFTQVGHKALPRGTDAPAAGISATLVLQGLAVTSLSWICNAFSLGCTIQSISDEQVSLSQFPVWLASVTLSTFLGFVVLIAPGGLGVREWVLVEVLKDQPSIGSDKAIVAAGLLRLVWFVAELVIAGVLYPIKPRSVVPVAAATPL